ncbi:hypothetical protein M8C21_030194 [Ambrosia artemisiifolia]|uniref:Rapid ALkalinization Factor n=1 Tax=Ambrosia artemisiifolia TaxID=4212 RepID=A0AAD5BMB2_AMBAR|nr:hypothetical protein M8C21_030194 [Ambrosia artemisiifolia]
MSNHSIPIIPLLLLASILLLHAVAAVNNHRVTFFPTTGCNGSTAECLSEGLDLSLEDDNEFLMDSESNRRILATRRRYISYGALSKNNVPCSRRGASYYNCRSGGQANPYTRGCSAITRCRR